MKLVFSIAFSLLLVVSHAQIKVDYRPYQSSVKNQKNRGTCTAFSICAALETFPGFPSDLSEQYIYALAKTEFHEQMPKYMEGGDLKYYIDILQKRGTLSEEKDPYNPNAPVWSEDESSFDKMKKDISGSLMAILKIHDFYYKLQGNMYIYRSGEQAQDVEWIKDCLDRGVKAIPVGYWLRDSYWFAHDGSREHKIAAEDFIYFRENGVKISYAEALKKYPDVVARERKGLIKAYYTDTSYSMNAGHAVAIVGYDESGFLIKNSWGTERWDKGYGWVSFEYHKMFADEVLSLHLGKVSVLDWKEESAEPWKKEEFYIKTLPNDYYNPFEKRHEKSMYVSFVYHGNSMMPRMKEIEIRAYDTDNKLIDTWYGSCQGIFDGRETGYGAFILNSPASTYPTVPKLIVDFTTSKGEKFTNYYSNLTSQNQEYKPRSLFDDLLIGK